MSTATKEQWVPCLVLEGEPLPDGITTSYLERLPGLYDTCAQATAAAWKVLCQRPDALSYSARRVEVAA